MAKSGIRFVEKLREQLRFIQRSCDAFDSGAEEEAFRIATALRVIFHNTSVSTSLVSHLDLQGAKMLSSARGHGNYEDYLSFRLSFDSPEPVKMVPLLGTRFRELPMSTWWSKEAVFVHEGINFSRSKIVLTAANQDGGAHVDANLDGCYKILCAGE